MTPEQLKGAHGSFDTVRIAAEVSEDNPHGFIVINAHDFDARKHELVETEEEQELSGFDWTTVSVKGLRAHLKAKSVAFDKDASKEELVALCEKTAAAGK